MPHVHCLPPLLLLLLLLLPSQCCRCWQWYKEAHWATAHSGCVQVADGMSQTCCHSQGKPWPQQPVRRRAPVLHPLPKLLLLLLLLLHPP
jgi:hypothetical protein